MNLKSLSSPFGYTLVAVLLIFSLGCGSKDLPAEIAFRNSVIGKGKVLVVTNKSAANIQITVTRGLVGGQSKMFTLPAKGKVEVGHLEGFEWSPNEVCSVGAEGYTDLGGRVP